MRCRAPHVAATVLIFLLAFRADAAPQAGAQAAPLTPGQLAVKALSPGPDLSSAVIAALASDQPGLRIVAARLEATLGQPEAAVDAVLRNALGRETIGAVAAEIVRALLVHGTPEDRQTVDAYLPQAGPRAIQAMAVAAATRSSVELLRVMPALHARLGDRSLYWLGPLLLNAARRDPSTAVDLIHVAVAMADDRDWSDFVVELRVSSTTTADGLALLDGLKSPSGALREKTVWFLVDRLALGAKLAPEIAKAALPDPANQTLTWERLGRELIARSVSHADPVDRADFIAGQRKPPAVPRIDRRVLTRSERAAFETLFGAEAAGALIAPSSSGVLEGDLSAQTVVPAMRSAESLWPGFLGDLLSVTGCSDKGTSFGMDIVTYAPDGRPQNIGVDSKGLPGGCVVALNVLGRLTLRDDARRVLPENRETIVLMPRQDIVACVDDFDPTHGDRPTPTAESADIQGPHKTHDVRPNYPKNAQSEHVQGTVLLRATIGRSGCVREASVVRSVYPSLDFEALRAVVQWQFSPTLLNEQPAEVAMTATVNYILQ